MVGDDDDDDNGGDEGYDGVDDRVGVFVYFIRIFVDIVNNIGIGDYYGDISNGIDEVFVFRGLVGDVVL